MSLQVGSRSLDSLAGRFNRPQLLWFMEAWLQGSPYSPSLLKERQSRLAAFAGSRRPIKVPSLPDLSPQLKWRHEMDNLGFFLSIHPLTAFEPTGRGLRHRIVPASDLGGHVGRRVTVMGWPVTRKEVLTREGESMEFVSFEDQSAIYEAVFFPKAYRRFCQELDMNRPYLLHGRVESEFGAVSLTVYELRPLGVSPRSGD